MVADRPGFTVTSSPWLRAGENGSNRPVPSTGSQPLSPVALKPMAVTRSGGLAGVSPRSLASTGTSRVDPLAGAEAGCWATSSPDGVIVKALIVPSASPLRIEPVSATKVV